VFDTWVPKKKRREEKQKKIKSIFIEVIVAHFWVKCVCPHPSLYLFLPTYLPPSLPLACIIYVALIEFCSPQKAQLKLLKKNLDKNYDIFLLFLLLFLFLVYFQSDKN